MPAIFDIRVSLRVRGLAVTLGMVTVGIWMFLANDVPLPHNGLLGYPICLRTVGSMRRKAVTVGIVRDTKTL